MFAQPAPGRTGKGHRVRVQTQFTLVLNIPASPRLPEPSLPAEGQEEAAPCPGLHVSCKQQTAPSPPLAVLLVRRKRCGPSEPAGVSRAEFWDPSSFENDDLSVFIEGKKDTLYALISRKTRSPVRGHLREEGLAPCEQKLCTPPPLA